MLIEGGYRNLYESLFKVINFMKNRSYEPLLRVITCRQHSNHTSNTVFDLIDCLSISLSPSQPPIAQGERKGRVCKGGGRGRVGRKGRVFKRTHMPMLCWLWEICVQHPAHSGIVIQCASIYRLSKSRRLFPSVCSTLYPNQ